MADPQHVAEHLLFAYISFKCHSGTLKCYIIIHTFITIYQAEI